MVYWETAHTIPDQPHFVLDWARQWQAAEKVVYSRTLAEPRSARTRIEREFDGVRLDLELLKERRFGNGVLILRYGVRGAARGLASA